MPVANDGQLGTSVQLRKHRAKKRPTMIRRTPDLFRTLPVELQVMCWEYLPAPDLAKLPLVCTHWRDVSAQYPQLWNHLRLDHVPADARPLFARSGNLKVLLTVIVQTCADWMRLPRCLRIVALRLYELRLVLAFARDGMSRALGCHEGPVSQYLFRYPAPVLNHLSISINTFDRFTTVFLPEDAFGGYAPNLRSVNLCGVELPPRCPAMQSVRDVWIGSQQFYCQEFVFSVFPNMVRLAIDNLKDRDPHPFLPRIPPGSQLTECEYLSDGTDKKGLDLSLLDMHTLGYLTLPTVTLRCATSAMIEFIMVDSAFYNSQTLIVNGNCSAHLHAEPEQHKSTLDAHAEALDIEEFQRFLEIEKHTSQIRHLVLPRYLPVGTPFVSRTVALPRPLTLTISCGELPHCGHSLFDPYCGFGIITAPMLTKIDIRRADGYTGEIEPLDPARVVDFIDNCLDCNILVEDDSDSDGSESTSSFDHFSVESYQTEIELCMDVTNGVHFLGRTTLNRYLLSWDSSGSLIMQDDHQAIESPRFPEDVADGER